MDGIMYEGEWWKVPDREVPCSGCEVPTRVADSVVVPQGMSIIAVRGNQAEAMQYIQVWHRACLHDRMHRYADRLLEDKIQQSDIVLAEIQRRGRAEQARNN